jgi:hypothetical protein
MLNKQRNIHWIFYLLLAVFFAACEKEYSYEGGGSPPVVVIPPVDTTHTQDSTILDPGALPNCPSCINTNDIPMGEWSFKTGNSLLCGQVDTAIMLSLERNTFTFYGPATCGADTGIIFTVSLGSNKLDHDLTNITATNAVYYYYHTFGPYVLVSHFDQPFMLIISSYNNTTKEISGTFSGIGYRQDGRAVNVSDGKFKMKII